MKKTRILTYMGLLTAIAIALRIFDTYLPQTLTKYGLSFIPIIFSSAALGPVLGGVVSGASDFLAVILRGEGFLYGFSISAILKGLIYGVFLYKKPKNLLNTFLAVITAVVTVDLFLNSYWVQEFFGTPYRAAFISKLFTLPIYAAAQIIIMRLLFKVLGKEIQKISE